MHALIANLHTVTDISILTHDDHVIDSSIHFKHSSPRIFTNSFSIKSTYRVVRIAYPSSFIRNACNSSFAGIQHTALTSAVPNAN
mmetsp:Transcript_31736/g.66760  ORF Transcript_31736/g.66760 Transcript_31736/m.66760 type:complete len:85 (-) Transcript_31736:48-302(-)